MTDDEAYTLRAAAIQVMTEKTQQICAEAGLTAVETRILVRAVDLLRRTMSEAVPETGEVRTARVRLAALEALYVSTQIMERLIADLAEESYDGHLPNF